MVRPAMFMHRQTGRTWLQLLMHQKLRRRQVSLQRTIYKSWFDQETL